MASEIIREKLMRFTGDELPYSVTVEIERFKVGADTGLYHINGLILVERDGQKQMVIGNKGEKIKTIGTEARIDMERLFETRSSSSSGSRSSPAGPTTSGRCVVSATVTNSPS